MLYSRYTTLPFNSSNLNFLFLFTLLICTLPVVSLPASNKQHFIISFIIYTAWTIEQYCTQQLLINNQQYFTKKRTSLILAEAEANVDYAPAAPRLKCQYTYTYAIVVLLTWVERRYIVDLCYWCWGWWWWWSHINRKTSSFPFLYNIIITPFIPPLPRPSCHVLCQSRISGL